MMNSVDVNWSNCSCEIDEENADAEPGNSIRGKFAQQAGPTTVLVRTATALDFFKLLFSVNIINNILTETNRYARQQLSHADGTPSRDWNPVTVPEFMAFLGIIVGMRIKKLPCIRDYWSSDWVLGVPHLVRSIPIARFRQIIGFYT